MGIVEICISFQVAIMGIAYPIILQVITDLDNKYSSVLITELLEKEKIWWRFKASLFMSLIATLLYIFINILGVWSSIFQEIYYALGLLIIVSAIGLVISFLYFIKKVLLYYSPKEFVQYLISKDNDA